MKSFLQSSLALLMVVLALGLALSAQAKPSKIKVSVLEFENRAGDSNCMTSQYDWTGWNERLGSGLQDMLITRIRKDGRFEILERATIKEMHANEHELINSKAAKTRAKGNFKVADYTLVGTVTEYEYCSQQSHGKVRLSFGGVGVGLGGKAAKAKVVVDIRVIDTNTGEVVAAQTGEGQSRSSSHDVGLDLQGVIGTDFGGSANDPLMKAARSAIDEAYKGLRDSVPSAATTGSGLAQN